MRVRELKTLLKNMDDNVEIMISFTDETYKETTVPVSTYSIPDENTFILEAEEE